MSGNKEERDAAFAALRAHPDFASWMAHDPDARDVRRGCRDLAGLALLLAVGAGAALVCLAFLPQLAFVPLGLLAVGALAGVAQLVRRPRQAPLTRWPARAMALRASVAGRDGSASHGRYAVVFEDEEGRSRELGAAPEAVGELPVGALGLVFARGGELLRFVPLVLRAGAP